MPANAVTNSRLKGTEALLRKKPFWNIADVTFDELMSAVIFFDGRPVAVETLARPYICKAVLEDVLTHHVLGMPVVDCDEEESSILLRPPG